MGALIHFRWVAQRLNTRWTERAIKMKLTSTTVTLVAVPPARAAGLLLRHTRPRHDEMVRQHECHSQTKALAGRLNLPLLACELSSLPVPVVAELLFGLLQADEQACSGSWGL